MKIQPMSAGVEINLQQFQAEEMKNFDGTSHIYAEASKIGQTILPQKTMFGKI